MRAGAAGEDAKAQGNRDDEDEQFGFHGSSPAPAGTSAEKAEDYSLNSAACKKAGKERSR